MSQTAFGLMILMSLLLVCTGMAVWAEWPNVKQSLSKLRLYLKR
jgi:predicted transporter